MLFIGVIFAILIGIIIFIYSGLRLTEGITNDTTYILYWVAYMFVGLSVGLIITLIYLWGDLQGKVGPPGPRGPPGDTGADGIPGECDESHVALGIMYTIREAIQELVSPAKSGSTTKVITDEGKLVNIFLEMRLYQMATSNQAKVLLETGKSVADITAYLKGIWQTWTAEILKLPKGQELFTTADAQTDISPEVAAYFANEIEKYDIWYWGTTPVFRPLKAEICRRSSVYNPASGNSIPNAYLPQPDRPELEFMEVEYSDRDTSKLTVLYDTAGMPATNPDRAKRWESITDTPTGYVSQPLFCIPKTVTKGKQVFYPICQVVVESNPKYMTDIKKKTILVSGDIIIPTILEQVWSGSAKGPTAEGVFYKVSTQVPGYICLGDYFLNKGQIITSTTGNKAQMLKPVDALKFLGYDLASGKILRTYRGIVAVPSKCIEKLERMPVPVWKYQMAPNAPEHVAVFESENASEGYYALRVGQYGNTIDDIKQGFSHYLISEKCTQTFEDVPVKELEAAFNDLGIGWFGHPAKQDQKYSIFSYLGIMPEGIITHRSSGRKYYIKHYGGNDANKYIIVKWSSDAGDFVQSLKAISDSAVITESQVSPSDKAQQWFIERDSSSRQYFRLKSVAFPNKYLSLDYNIGLGWNKYANPDVSLSGEDKSLLPVRPKGVSVSHTDVLPKLVGAKGTINAANRTLFSNMPAYGVNYDIVEKAENRKTRGMSFNQQRDEQEKIGPQTDFKYIMSGTSIIPVNDRDSSVPDNKVVFS